MQKRMAFLFSLSVSIGSVQAQKIAPPVMKFTNAVTPWNYDSLGNHRVLISVPANGTVAKVTIPWRRRDQHPELKQMWLIDAKTNQRIYNVQVLDISREKGTILFEPLSGKGNYYLYYMPVTYKGNRSIYYPDAHYYKDSATASAEWLATIKQTKPVSAIPLELQSVNAFNSFYPMEVIATAAETKAIIAKYKSKDYLVFPEDREHSIRMRFDLPQRWIETGARSQFSDKADKGENFAYQLGIYPVKKALKNVTVVYSDLKTKSGAVISHKNIECLNTTGVNWIGKPESFTVNVPTKEVQPMWALVNIPEDAQAGTYTGTATVKADNAAPTTIKITLTVSDKTAVDHGTNEPWKQTRLAWLNSTLAEKNDVIAPYTPLQLSNNEISLLGRKVKIAKSGLPAQVTSYFTEEMTEIGNTAKPVLTEPMHFHITDQNAKEISFQNVGVEYTEQTPGTIGWKAVNNADGLQMIVKGALEFDGFMDYEIAVIAKKDISLKDIKFHIPMKENASQYLMGLGEKGGLRKDDFHWKWDVAHKNQDGAWIGDVNAGLQFSLRDEKYERPLNTNFYLQKPLFLPSSWGNDNKGGIDIGKKGNSILVNAYSGERTMKAGDTLYYNVKMLITPFHTLNTDWQWYARFLRKHVPIDTAKALGATVINIHQGTTINPYINYPFIKNKELKAYIDSAHQEGMKVKIYNTVRELSNRAYELPALFSLGHEIYSKGKSGGYSWLQEHLDTSYIAAWYTPEANDAAIVNSGMSRWHNYYVEGLKWLTKNIGIDGIYLDDVAFDRTIVKRIKRVMMTDDHEGLIDLHSANQFNRSDGYNNSANLYMELFPYLNRLWFGEYFDYEKGTPDFYMTEVSGIPFGLMGEMLQNNGNLYRGMLYGMTNRLLWTGGAPEAADPHPVWKIMDVFGMKGSKMIGYWVKSNPVKTDNANVLATVYKKEKSALVSLASWASTDVDIHLTIDWNALGIDAAKAKITAVASEGFQPGKTFQPGESIPVAPNKGWLLIISE